jgi:hypothetical protein
LKKKLQRLQEVERIFAINVKFSLEKLRALQQYSQKQFIISHDDSQNEIMNSQKHIEQEEIRVLQQFMQKEDFSKLSQENEIRDEK